MAEVKTLAAAVRSGSGKGAARSVRREGRTPAVIYGGGDAPEMITLDYKELNKLIYAGHFLTTIFDIDIDGRKVHTFNIHLDDSPYQPYQLLNIPYGDTPFLKTADEAVKAAQATRGPGLKILFEDMDAAGPSDADFVFGDFNEPSHRDWTESAVKAGFQPMVVPFPTVMAIEDKGFVDTFRAIYPDAGVKPGMTWTPTTDPAAKDDHHDRIDFALARGKGIEVIAAGIVGEKAPEADIVVTPWPSDHRATMAKVKF